MQKTSNSESFVRINTHTRNRLRRFCRVNGHVMGRLVSTVIAKYLDRQERPKLGKDKLFVDFKHKVKK